MTATDRTKNLPPVQTQAASFPDGYKVLIFNEKSDPLVEAAWAMTQARYAALYPHIAAYLLREDELISTGKTLHFVLIDEEGKVKGHQMLCGNGTDPVPSETLHPQVNIRKGSRHLFEVKRAALFERGRYWQLTHAIGDYFTEQYGGIDNIPADHCIIGYSVESKVVDHLINHGYELQYVFDHEHWISFPTRELASKYLAPQNRQVIR